MPSLDSKRPPATNTVFVLIMIVSMIIWGGSWVSAKVVASKMSAEQLSFWRFLLSALSFVPLLFMFKTPLALSRGSLLQSILAALSMSAYMYYFFRGLEHGLAGAAGVLVTSMMPLMTLLFSFALLKRGIKQRDVVGLAIGLIGGAILLKLWDIDTRELLRSGNLYFLLCSALWALVTIFSQKAAADISPYFFSLIVYGLSALFFLPSTLNQGFDTILEQDQVFWLNLVFLSIISSTFATTVYFIAAEKLGSYRTSSFVFLVPSSAMFLSWIFLGEVPEPATIIGGTIAVSAVYVINRRSG